MKILIAGASGFIGRNLVEKLIGQHEVTALGRNKAVLKKHFPRISSITWKDLNSSNISQYDLVINLCGEDIAKKRWSKNRKVKIIKSRLEPTNKLICYILESEKPNKIRLLNASAIGIYGKNQSNIELNSDKEKNTGFFSQEIIIDWEKPLEASKLPKRNWGCMRFAVVLKKHEGMLKRLELPYKLFLASSLGSGKQMISWIHINDLTSAIKFLVERPEIHGSIDMSAPNPVMQKDFARQLSKALNRPCFLTTPAWIIRGVFGQMGEELLLSGQKVLPNTLQSHGFVFKYPELTLALAKEYN